MLNAKKIGKYTEAQKGKKTKVNFHSKINISIFGYMSF